ncbi:MAG: hypothetical protein U5K71_03125 [Gracilimonas sp.]|nr:hypothetical protein [Gracilimonas sp.]
MRSIVDSLFTATEAYYEKTIGPSSNSTDLSKEILLKRLNSYVSISCNELGWITNQGICNSLEVKLRNVERYLENEKPKQAANALNAFLKEVEAQKDKALSSEAYALLYFNGQYLLEKLKANEN